MNIFIYWNYKDNDSKKMYQFLNQPTFFDLLREGNNIIFHKAHQDFIIDNLMHNEIRNSDIVLFFTHGDDDSILKFRYKDELLKERFIFLDLKNAELLRGKKVIAICCCSANQLGEYCVSENIQSEFFVGFQDDLIYDEGFSDEFKRIVFKTYSSAFERAFINAYKKKWSAERFVLILKKYIIDMLTSEILSSPNRKLGSFSGASFHWKTAEALVALGKSEQLVFE